MSLIALSILLSVHTGIQGYTGSKINNAINDVINEAINQGPAMQSIHNGRSQTKLLLDDA
jgi:hypothetical protein